MGIARKVLRLCEQKMMKDMFVCMGRASTTDTDAWVSQAKIANDMVSTPASSSPRAATVILPQTASDITDTEATDITDFTDPDGPVVVTRPVEFAGYESGSMGSESEAVDMRAEDLQSSSARFEGTAPQTLCAMMSSILHTGTPLSPRTDSTWRDSGIASSRKLSVYSSTVGEYREDWRLHDPQPNTREFADGVTLECVQSEVCQPLTPRADDTKCKFAPNSKKTGFPVYATPPKEEDLDESLSSEPTKDDGRVFENIDEVSAVVVGVVLKNILALLTDRSNKQVLESYKVIKGLLKDDTSHNDMSVNDTFITMTTEDLNDFVFSVNEPSRSQGFTAVTNKAQLIAARSSAKLSLAESPRSKTMTVMEPFVESKEEEEPLLNSDEDYDDDRDKIFKKSKEKKVNVTHKKGVDNLKRFLKKTNGEKNWYFWMDIDRGRLLLNKEDIPSYLVAMRERYLFPGAPYELSLAVLTDLGLVEPSQWTMSTLSSAQNKVAEPLVLYWMPRFLLQQSSAARPERNYMYNLQRQTSPPVESFPNPATISLLPLRPKTCMPRLPQMEPPVLTITSLFDDVIPAEVDTNAVTSPRVGMRRMHSIPDMYKDWKDQKKEQPKHLLQLPRTPKQVVYMHSINARSKTEVPHPPKVTKVPLKKPSPKSTVDQWDAISYISMPSSVTSDSQFGKRRPASGSSSQVSEFSGGRRMESLLQALASEKKSGGVIRKYLDHTGNQLWLNCLSFWHELQEYHNMFYVDVLDTYLLQKKAMFILSQYIVESATHSIHCISDIRDFISAHADPPFEDLFDLAEEFIFDMLYDAWAQMIISDLSTFDKVELIEVKRHINTTSPYLEKLTKKGILKEQRPSSMDDVVLNRPDQVDLTSLATSASWTVPINYSNVQAWLSVPRTREAIMCNYLTVPGTSEVLGQQTLMEHEQLIADVTNLQGSMKHLSEQDKQSILFHMTQEQDEAKIADFFEQLELGEGTFNTLTKAERGNIIKQVHVHKMLNTTVPTERDLDMVTDMYGGIAEENEGLVNEQRLHLLQDLQQGKGLAGHLAVSLKQELARHLQVGSGHNISQEEKDDLIHRVLQERGKFSVLSEDDRRKVVSMLVIAAGAEIQVMSSPGSQLEVVKNLRTRSGGMEALGEEVCVTLQRHIDVDEKRETVSHKQRMEMISMVHTGEGDFATLSEEHREDIMGVLKLAARSKFMVDVSERAQDRVLDQIEMGSASNVMEVRRIKEHLVSSMDSKKGTRVTMRDRDDLIAKLESGEAGAEFTESDKEMLLKHLKVVKQKETRKILDKHRERPSGGKPGGFGEFAEDGGTLGEVVKKLEAAGLDLGHLVTTKPQEDPMLKYKDPVYDKSIIQAIPDEFKDYSLRKLIRNRIELEHFREFLAENYASMDLLCWMDVEAFQRINDNKKRDEKAKDFKNKYMNRKYFFGNNSPAQKAGQDTCEMDPAASAAKNKDAGSHLSSDLKLPSIENDSPNGQMNGVPTAATKPDLPSTEKLPPLESKAVPKKTPIRKRSVSFKLAHTTNEETLDKEQEQEDKKRTSAVVVDPDVEPSEEEIEVLVLEFIDEVMAVGGGWGKILEDRMPTACILEAQKYVQARLDKKWLPLFISTPEFALRQRPKSSLNDIVEDIMIQKKKRSQAVCKLLESQWVTSAAEIIMFRKALMNPITSLQFKRFVSIKDGNNENNVLFWLEVQRYKDLCHTHSDRKLVQQKTIAIINCFIDSSIPPAIQVDITQEMADDIIEHKLDATPYIFRTAQLAVFRILFQFWSDFCHLRQNTAEEKILPTIERHRRRAKAANVKRELESKGRKEKLKLQRKAARKLEKQLEKERRQRQERLGSRANSSSSSSSSVAGFVENSPKRASSGTVLARSAAKDVDRKRLLGIHIDTEAEHQSSSDNNDDDQDMARDESSEMHHKDPQVAWSYSGYMNALKDERVLNEIDQSEFSSLSSEKIKTGSEHIELTDDPPVRISSGSGSRVAVGNPGLRSSSGSQSGLRAKSSRPRSSRTRELPSGISHPDRMVVRPPHAPPSECTHSRRRPVVARSRQRVS